MTQSLTELREIAGEQLATLIDKAAATVAESLRLGETLEKMRPLVIYGNWEPYLDAEFGESAALCRSSMRLCRNRTRLPDPKSAIGIYESMKFIGELGEVSAAVQPVAPEPPPTPPPAEPKKRRGRKKKAAETKPAEPTKASLPESAAKAIELIATIRHHLARVVGAMKELAESGATSEIEKHVDQAVALAQLEALDDTLKFHGPVAVCPQPGCNGRCPRCLGRGWITETERRNLPAELAEKGK